MLDAILSVIVPILETMFLVGLVGSAVVVIISFIEDFKTMSGKH